MIKVKTRTRIKNVHFDLKENRLFTDFGGICYYKVLKIYRWKEYSKHAETPDGSHWFDCDMAKIKTETGVVYKIPWIELGLRSVYANSGERVLK